MLAPIALTCGEPSGIGPDLCLVAATKPRSWPLVCLADRELLAVRARRLKLKIQFSDYRIGGEIESAAGTLSVLHEPLATPCVEFTQQKPLFLARRPDGAVQASAACDQLDNRSGVADT